MPITSTIQQGTLSLAAVTPGNSAIGDAAAAGTSASVARADHKHGREASGTPGASAVGDTASAGTASTIARSDHVHGREAFGTPVNIDASLTSLSTGSLTTVARADHVHTVSKVPVLLWSTTLGSAAASISIANIPATYINLLVLSYIKSTAAAVNPQTRMTYNSDVYGTGTKYDDQTGAGLSYLLHGFSHGSTNYLPYHTGMRTMIYNYANTFSYKMALSEYSCNVATTLSLAGGYAVSYWRDTSAISTVKIQLESGNIAAGSAISVYGYP